MMRAPGHWPTLVFKDGDGDLCRCECGEQGFDFLQGREWFAHHIAERDDEADDAILAAVAEARRDSAAGACGLESA